MKKRGRFFRVQQTDKKRVCEVTCGRHCNKAKTVDIPSEIKLSKQFQGSQTVFCPELLFLA